MHFLPSIPIRDQQLALAVSDSDFLELLTAITAIQPEARRSSWSRLLRLSPTMLVWCKSRFSTAHDFSALIDCLASDHAALLHGLRSAPSMHSAPSLDEKWFDQFRRYLSELDWLAHANSQTAPQLAVNTSSTASVAGSSTGTVVAKRSHHHRLNRPESARLVSLLESLIRPFWQGPTDDLTRWIGEKFANFSFELRLDDQDHLETSADQQWSQAMESWRNGSAATKTLLTDVMEQLWRANRQAAHWQCEKLESLKQLAYGASHEINNPLANIATRAQLLVANEKDDSRRKQLTTIFQQAMRAHEMISDMMLFAHPPEPELRTIELVELIHNACAEFSPLVEQAGWTIDCSGNAGQIQLQADTGQIISLLQAIVQNSIESRSAGHINIACENSHSRIALIEISDNGPGISEDAARHLFDPFYSGREAGRGLGFGLSKAWTIARLHDGDIRIKSTGPGGTTIRVELPISK